MNAQQREDIAQLLAKLSQAQVRSYSTYDFGREKDDRCLSVVVSEDQARQLLPRVRASLPEGTVAFIGTGGTELVVGPGSSQFDILRLARSDAANYALQTEDLIKKLQTYDKGLGISIWRAETDTIEFDLLRNPSNPSAFAKDLYEFCPDIVDQGAGSLSDLEEQIDITGSVFLWWD